MIGFLLKGQDSISSRPNPIAFDIIASNPRKKLGLGSVKEFVLEFVGLPVLIIAFGEGVKVELSVKRSPFRKSEEPRHQVSRELFEVDYQEGSAFFTPLNNVLKGGIF